MEPVGKEDENIENKRRRLIFRSAHRGIKEMDIILGTFANNNVADFTEEELKEFDTILSNNDPDLYNWLTEKEPAPENIATMSAFKKLMQHEVS